MSTLGDLYRRLFGMAKGQPTSFGWVLDGKLAGSGRPMSEKELLWAKRTGIKCVITLTEHPLPAEWVDGNGLDYLHFAFPNHTVPTPDFLDRVVESIRERIGSGQAVMVHCAAGKGRTGTVLAAYLVKERKLSAEDAMFEVRRLRPGSIERHQEEAIRAYEQSIARS